MKYIVAVAALLATLGSAQAGTIENGLTENRIAWNSASLNGLTENRIAWNGIGMKSNVGVKVKAASALVALAAAPLAQ